MPRDTGFLLKRDLKEIRDELLETVAPITDEELDYVPREGMRSYRGQLQEIGTTEYQCMEWIRNKAYYGWQDLDGLIGDSATSKVAMVEKLIDIRNNTLAYIGSLTDEELRTPVPMPKQWHPYQGVELEPAEMIRWIARHEYYHLGQIIVFRWIQGHNPYEQD